MITLAAYYEDGDIQVSRVSRTRLDEAVAELESDNCVFAVSIKPDEEET